MLSLLHVVLIFGLAFMLWKKQEPALKRAFWPALAVRLIAGICLGLLYTYYFPVADTFVYFSDATQLAELARTDVASYLGFLLFDQPSETLSLTFQEPRAVVLTKITSVFNILTGDNYWICGFYFSFISFLAAWYLVQTIEANIPSVRWAAVIAFLFFPSVVFWTSGLLKESIAMAALFFLAAVFLKLWFRKKPRAWAYMVALVSLLLLWNLKYYYVAVFVPVVFAGLVYRLLFYRRTRPSASVRMLLLLAFFLLLVALITFLHPNFNADRVLEVIVSNNVAYNALSDPGETVQFEDLRPTVGSLLMNAPWALFSGLFRPLFWEADAIVPFVAGVENTFLLMFTLAAALRLRKSFSSAHGLLVVMIVVFVAFLCVLITISAPNFGTLSRYRVGYLSFFVFLILCNNPVLQYIERSMGRLVSH